MKDKIDILTQTDFTDMMLTAARQKIEETFICHFDGACEPVNPGGMIGAGVHVSNGKTVWSQSEGYPAAKNNTNNVAEYLAFLKLMNYLEDCDRCTIKIFGDSKLVIRQMSGRWRILNGSYKDHALKAKIMFDELCEHNKVKIAWIPRERNTEADELSKKGILNLR